MAIVNTRILLIESEPILAECTGFRLELLGYQVDTVGTAAAAESYLAAQKPDLILLNLELSDLPGLVLVEQLTNQAELTRIPMLAMSMQGEIDLVQKAFTAGIWDLVLIPYDPAVLEDKVLQLLQQAKRSEQPAKKKAKSNGLAAV